MDALANNSKYIKTIGEKVTLYVWFVGYNNIIFFQLCQCLITGL